MSPYVSSSRLGSSSSLVPRPSWRPGAPGFAALVVALAAIGCVPRGATTASGPPPEGIRVADLAEIELQAPAPRVLVDWLALAANPFEGEALGPLADHAARARLVLLGESTHGTEEWYTLRAALSRDLIARHGFRFVAVEGDWDAIDRLNAYVRGESEAASARAQMADFDRWPRWMWANESFADFVEWLAEHNRDRPEHERAGVYGMDLYGDRDSARRVVELLGDGDVAATLPCMGRFVGDGGRYRGALRAGQAPCARELEGLVARARAMVPKRPAAGADERRRLLRARANALVLKHAERHHRALGEGGPGGWNSRASFFFRVVDKLLTFYGAESRGIVWAHNTHVGDARATPMGRAGQVNIGQMARDALGRGQVFTIGFATRTGEVLAGSRWGAPVEVMSVPPAPEESWEALMGQVALPRFFFLLRGAPVPEVAREERGHRAIGVSYDPSRDAVGNQVPSVLPRRYDAMVFVDETAALRAL